jgi:hypothetical protein
MEAGVGIEPAYTALQGGKRLQADQRLAERFFPKQRFAISGDI